MLGSLLVRERLITRDQLRQALDIQAHLGEYVPLGQVLVDRGIITQGQLSAVLERYHKKDRLGDILVETKVISEEELERVLEDHRRTGRRLGETLLRLGLATELQIKQALCAQLRISFLDLDQVTIDVGLRHLVGKSYARRHRAIPLIKNRNRLTVALDDPGEHLVVQDLGVSTGCAIEVVTGTSAAFDRAFARLYEDGPQGADRFSAALEQAERERSSRADTETVLAVEIGNVLGELTAAGERLGGLERRFAGISRLVAELRAESELANRERQEIGAAVRSLGALQIQIVEAVAHLQAGQEALRREQEANSGMLRGLSAHHNSLLEERRSIIASIESTLSRLRKDDSA